MLITCKSLQAALSDETMIPDIEQRIEQTSPPGNKKDTTRSPKNEIDYYQRKTPVWCF